MQSGKSTIHKTGRYLSLAALTILIAGWSLWNAGCKKDEGNGSSSSVRPALELTASDFTSPVALAEAPDNTHRLFVVDQTGKIWVILADGRKLSQPFLDISASMVSLQSGYDERGLLGLAFHPDFKSNGKFYVYYTAPSNGGGPVVGVSWNHVNRISEFRVTGSNMNIANPATERVVLQVNHPAANHNGGAIAFGPDGYLYIAIGDGGDKDDVGAGHVADWYAPNGGGNAQNLSANLLGKVLRIDVSGNPYNVPADNPYVSTPNVKEEIWAYGFRNPYRFSFDMGGNRELYLGDVGQSLYEEINLVTKGGNYGWNVREGVACFNTDDDRTTRSGCPTVDPMGVKLSDPIVQLDNAANPNGGGIATAIVGGYVYRGATFPQLQGTYIFGTYSQKGGPDGKVYTADKSATPSGLHLYVPLDIRSYESGIGQYIKGFGQDASGEMYILTAGVQGPAGTTGKVYKLIAAQ